MNALMSAKPNQTMTSLEIADLTGKRHDNVKRTIEILSRPTEKRQAVIQLPHCEEVKNHLGQLVTQYVFSGEQGKLDSITITAQLCPEFTAAIVKRWQELESQRPPTRLEMAHMLVEAETRLAQATEQLAIAEPKVNYYDAVVDRSNMLIASQISQKVKISAVRLNKFLDGMKVYNKSVKRSRVFQQWFIDKGYGSVRQTESGYPQAMFTLAGEAWVIEKLISAGVITQ